MTKHRFIAIIFTMIAMLYAMDSVAQILKQKSSSIVNISGESYYVHTVKKGETVYSLSKLYEISEELIVKNNPQAVEGISIDQVLKIPATDLPKPRTERQMDRIFEYHTVKRGETIYSISKIYGVEVPVLMEDNPRLDPTMISIGQVINIRKNNIGDLSDKEIDGQWAKYTTTMNSVAQDYKYHMVERGETVYSISKKYSVSQNELIELNQLQGSAIRAGSIIKIPPAKEILTPVDYQTKDVHVTPVDEKVKQLDIKKTATSPLDNDVKDVYKAPTESQTFGKKQFNTSGMIDMERYKRSVLHISMLLPFTENGNTVTKSVSGSATSTNFLEFYQGAQIALNELRISNSEIVLHIFDTEHSANTVETIVNSRDFQNTDIIIGPVYEEGIESILEFANREHIAVLSPLAGATNASSPLIYQLAADNRYKYDKLKQLLTPSKNVIVVNTVGDDTDFKNELISMIPKDAKQLTYSKNITANAISNLLESGQENIFIIPSNNEIIVDEILARISSIQNNLVARSARSTNIRVLGTSKWARFSNIDKNLFFKLNVCYIVSYHADRSNVETYAFSNKYIKTFGSLPSLYSYRGYDALKLAVAGMTKESSFTSNINASSNQLLQMPYHFEQPSLNGVNINTEWALVSYNSTYTIEIL